MESKMRGLIINDEATRTQIVEVYEYPPDCVASELSCHFSRVPYSAECKTPLDEMWNHRFSTFILEFEIADAERILKTPVQVLDEEDPESEIRVGLLNTRRCAQVLVSCEHEMNYRMIRRFFRSFGRLADCQPSSGLAGYRLVLTFQEQSAADKVCATRHHNIGPAVSVHTQLLTDAIANEESASPTETTLSLSFDFDSVSCIDVASSNPRLTVDGSQDSGIQHASPLTLSTESTELSSIGELITDDTGHYETVDVGSSVAATEPAYLTLLRDPDVPSTTPSFPSTSSSAPSFPPPPPAPPVHFVPTVNLNSCIQVNNCIIRLILGDLSEHSADALVHSNGMAMKALFRKGLHGPGGTQTVRLIEAVNGQPHGQVRVMTAPNLPARYIFSIKRFEFLGTPDGSQHLIKLCLQHCDKLKLKSVAFPAIGTGMEGEPPKAMANLLIGCIVDYMQSHPLSSLEIVDIVIFQHQMLNDYSISLKRATSSSMYSNFTKILSKSRGKVDNVYQISNFSHKVLLDSS